MTRRRKGLVPLAAILTIAVVATTATADDSAKERSVVVNVDPRVELMSVIFRLAGNREYSDCRLAAYANDVQRHFGPHRNHPVIERARRLRREHSVSYDAVMGMAVHMKDVETMAEVVPFDPRPEGLDARWAIDEARAFLADARDFAKTAKFAQFFADHRELYATTVSRMEDLLDRDGHLEWFDEFFGARPQAKFTLTLGLLNGPQCYGSKVVRGRGEEDLFCIFGVWRHDDDGMPVFEKPMLNYVVHEFAHSYVNPIVYAHEKQLEEAGTIIFPFVQEIMSRQAYGRWIIMMHESVVRACVVRYVSDHRGPAAIRQELLEQNQLGFTWVEELAVLLADYEGDRETYPRFEDFFPKIIGFFDDFAPRFAAEQRHLRKHVPKLISLTPKNGAGDVDPAVKAIVITFDRAMQKGNWSVVGGGDDFPEVTGRPSYDASGKVLTIPVRLKPGWTYRFQLNSPRHQGFRSSAGVALEPVPVEFRTTKG